MPDKNNSKHPKNKGNKPSKNQYRKGNTGGNDSAPPASNRGYQPTENIHESKPPKSGTSIQNDD